MRLPQRKHGANSMLNVALIFRLLVIGIIAVTVVSWFSDSPLMLQWKQYLIGLCENQTTSGLIIGSLCYIALLAIPFVPGVELGILLMLVFGKTGVVLVYLSTIAGLSLAFACGRWLQGDWNVDVAGERKTHLKPILQQLTTSDRCSWPHRLAIPHAMRNQYVCLGLLLNMPGNSMLGGGGGIAAMYGMSKKMKWSRFLLTTTIAVCPVPVIFLLGFGDYLR
ncbi:MAG: hypothetical protein OEZ43_05885 [Gammaproteobacteria bacterium]|nr:hypothetical protein [Gammaproteobacteria bacterium]